MYYVYVSKAMPVGEVYEAELTDKGVKLTSSLMNTTLEHYDTDCLFDNYRDASRYLSEQLDNHPDA